jgi:deoxyribose-phosphate aldolase
MEAIDRATLALVIDHTLLTPEATSADIVALCTEADELAVGAVCISPNWVSLVHKITKIPVASVVGFPSGSHLPGIKAAEAAQAVSNGASEIDMVINIGALKSKDYQLVFDDICRVVTASRPWPVKVILETGGLSNDEKIVGCALSKAAGAAFVKTSTGFGPGGATVEDIQLMRRIVGGDIGVKASGGVRSTEDALKMREAGADRIGASASVAIVTGAKSNSKY